MRYLRHSGYLMHAARSFYSICDTDAGSSLFVFGHSLGPSDDHILGIIEEGAIRRIFLSIKGDIAEPRNVATIARARRMMEMRNDGTLQVYWFESDEAHVWG